MKSPFSSIWRLVLAGLLLTCLLAVGAPINDDDQKSIAAISDYLVPSVDRVTPFLESVEFNPPVAGSTWRQYPAIRKLETAYRMAEAKRPGQGKELLQAFYGYLADDFGSVRSHDWPPGFRPPDDWEPPQFQFTRGPPPPNSPRLSGEHRQVIEALADYAEHSPAGGTHHVLTTHFGLTFDDAYEVLNTSSSTQDAMLRAFNRVPEQERRTRLHTLAKALAEDYDSIHHDQRLAAFWAQMPPDGDVPPPATPSRPGPDQGPNPGGDKPGSDPHPPEPRGPVASGPIISGPAPEPRRSTGRILPTGEVTTRYTGFVRKNYGVGNRAGTLPRINFRMAASRVRGFGGVMFGNTVKGPDKVHVKTVHWVPPTDSGGDGELEFELNDRTVARLPGVRPDIAFVARSLVFAPPQGVDPPKPGDGIGLVGIEPATPLVWPLIEEASGNLDLAVCYDLVIHPALANTEIGWCIVGLDSLPIITPFLSAQAQQHLRTPEAAANVDALWSALKKSGAGTWRIVDVPLEVTISPAGAPRTVSVRRTADGPESYPEGLRSTAFLEMWPILRESDDEVAEQSKLLADPVGHRGAAGPPGGTRRAPSELAKSRLKKLRGPGKSDNVDRMFAAEFYRHLPQLCQASADYAGANALARVLACLRWAASTGAEFSPDGLTAPPPVATPQAVLLSEHGGVQGKSFAEGEDRSKVWMKETFQIIDSLAADSPDLQELVQGMKGLFETQDQLFVLAWKKLAAKDEAEKETITAKIKELREGIEARRKELVKVERRIRDSSPALREIQRLDQERSAIEEQLANSWDELADAEGAAAEKAAFSKMTAARKQIEVIDAVQTRVLNDAKGDHAVSVLRLLSLIQ